VVACIGHMGPTLNAEESDLLIPGYFYNDLDLLGAQAGDLEWEHSLLNIWMCFKPQLQVNFKLPM